MREDKRLLPTKILLDDGRQSLKEMMRTLGPFMPAPDRSMPETSSQWKLSEQTISEKTGSVTSYL